MTLREAVEIVLKSCGEFTRFPDSEEDIERANAIVDAAESAWRDLDAIPDDQLTPNQRKLRALERGEETP
jgi:hypothetical protein